MDLMEADNMRTWLLTVALAMAPLPAVAAPITGGESRVVLTSDLTGLALDTELTGTASIISLSPFTAGAPITGGDVDAAIIGQILHVGAGLTLRSATDTLTVTDFIIDTTVEQILGDIAVNGAAVANDLALFSFDLSTVTVGQLTDLANPALALFVTSSAAAQLTSVFGVADLTGREIGLLAKDPVTGTTPPPVSEPATAGLLAFAAGAAFLGRRRKRP